MCATSARRTAKRGATAPDVRRACGASISGTTAGAWQPCKFACFLAAWIVDISVHVQRLFGGSCAPHSHADADAHTRALSHTHVHTRAGQEVRTQLAGVGVPFLERRVQLARRQNVRHIRVHAGARWSDRVHACTLYTCVCVCVDAFLCGSIGVFDICSVLVSCSYATRDTYFTSRPK